MTEFLPNVEALAARISSGQMLALAPDYSGCALAVVRALIRAQARELHVVGTPQLGLQGDMLIGAGCVQTLQTAAVTLGEKGPAPRFTQAVKQGQLELLDATCPAIHAGLQAAEKGLPFMPLRGLIGSDVLHHRSDWVTIENPFGSNDPIVALPAITPDVTLFHARLADREGNVWIGVRRELMLLAHASRSTLVSVEAITDDNLLEDERYAAGTIPSLYVDALCEAPHGAWPVGLSGAYAADDAHLSEYAVLARTDEGFAAYLERYVFAQPAKRAFA